MTQLARNNMHMGFRVAGRTFTAMCGHRIKKGERYFVSDDYFANRRYHKSECLNCARRNTGVVFVEKEAS